MIQFFGKKWKKAKGNREVKHSMSKPIRWCYKTVFYELKKEGILGGIFLDEAEVEESLNEYGKAGWELVSVMEIHGGLIAIFKQPITITPSFIEEPQKEIITPREQEETDTFIEEATEQESKIEELQDTRENDDGIGKIRIE